MESSLPEADDSEVIGDDSNWTSCIIAGSMPLAEKTRFGPYEIISLLGAGGMGEVYQARDTRLDRTVAIKIWAPFHLEEPNNNNAELQAFMLELRTQWYKYIEKTTGVTVRQHDSD